jgi:type I restriction enzyme S subunit
MQIQQAKSGYKYTNVILNINQEVPEDWQIRKLGSFAKEINLRYSEYKDGPVLSVTKHRGFVKSLEYFNRQVYSKDIVNYKLVEKGDFAYATIHLDEGSLGLLREFDLGYISPMYTVFRTDTSLNSDFLYLLLRSNFYVQIYSAIGKGSINRRKSISFDNLSQLKIPMPRVKEQQKIAFIISKVDELIQKTDQVIEQTQRLKKGLMQKLLTKGIGHREFNKQYFPFKFMKKEIPLDWKVVQLCELSSIVRGGSPRPAGDPKYFGGNIPWITVGELTKDDLIYLNSVSTGLTESGKERSRFLEKGTVVLANSGATLGVPKILNFSGCINDGVAAFLSPSKDLITEFLYHVLFSWIKILRDVNQGMGQPNLNTEIIGNLYFPLPPIEEQKKIALILSKVDESIRTQQDYKSKLETLKRGLMQKLLTGKIRVRI